jgi:nitroreductase
MTDPLSPIAQGAIEHMNSDHADAVLAYARGIAGLRAADSARVTGIDARGLDLEAMLGGQAQAARVMFDAPLTSPEQLRPALVALAERARVAVETPAMVISPAPRRGPDTAAALFNTIATRRSFGLNDVSPEPVDVSLIEQMLDAANWAPSHGKTEPWRFTVFTGVSRAQLGEAFARAYCALNLGESPDSANAMAQRKRAFQAPVWIALGMQPNPRMPEWEELIAFGSAVQNAHLMAGALGLACKWTSGAVVMHEEVARAIGFAPDIKLYGFLYVGRPAVKWPDGQRKPLTAKTRWVESEH